MDTLSLWPQDGNPTKHCNGCNRDLPATLEYFSPQKQNKNGLTSQCKQCHAAHAARYRQKNPEKVKAYERVYKASERSRQYKARYNAAHREERKQYKATWHQAHREEQRQYSLTYNAEHREERRAGDRKRRAERREDIRQKRRVYRQTDHGRLLHRAHENNRRARKVLLEGTLTAAQIQEKLKCQKYKCYYCFARFEKKDGKYLFHLEHTIPVSRTQYGPRHDINSVVLACRMCNIKKNNKLPHEWAEGGRLL